MRKVDESRAANYIRKHSNYKKWLAFVLCLSLLTGTITLYTLNKPATAMTEDGAEEVGVILDTASSEDEAELIQETMENKLESQDDGDDDDDLFDFGDGDNNDDDDEDGDGEDADELKKSGDNAETEDLVEEEETEGEEEAEEEDELTENVVLTASYVDEDGEAIADDKEISDDLEFSEDAPSIEGYTFKKATYKSSEITKITVKNTEDDIRYFEVTFEDGEEKEIKKDATIVLTYTADEKKELVLTASYVDEDGKEIADEEELAISESFDPKKDADAIEGYTFKEAKIDEDVVTLITAIVDEESEEKYYEATLEDESTVEIKQDTEIKLTYAVVDTTVVLTANYVDRNGEEIQDSQDLNIGDETELKKSKITEVDGYFFYKAIYEEKEIAKIAPIFGEDEKEADSKKDDTEETDTEETDTKETDSEDAVVKTVGYKFTTVDGDEIEITEDTEIDFTYLKASTETEFTFSDSKVTVTAIINGKNVFPEGIELKAIEVTKYSSGYNYDAYMDALNENADELVGESGQENGAEFTEDNTLLYDIAFMFEDKELQPKEGSVSISVEFNQNQLSEDLSVVEEEDLTVIHLPLKDEIRNAEEFTSTRDTTDISSSDIEIITLTDASTELGDVEKVEFEENNFSVFVFKDNSGQKNTWNGGKTIQLSDFAKISPLFNHAVVANEYYATDHLEGSVMVGTFYTSGSGTIINQSGRKEAANPITEIVVEKKVVNGNDGIFNFGFYEKVYEQVPGTNEVVEKNKQIKSFSIKTENSTGTLTIGRNAENATEYASVFSALDAGKELYVYELDDSGQIVFDNQKNGTYTVGYAYSDFLGGGQTEIANDHDANYIGKIVTINNASIGVDVNSFFGTTQNYMGDDYHRLENSENYYFGNNPNFYVMNLNEDSKDIKKRPSTYFTHIDGLLGEIAGNIQTASELSAELAKANNYPAKGQTDENTLKNVVNVINLRSSDGNLKDDLSNAGFENPYIRGLIDQDQYLLINISYGGDSYTLNDAAVNNSSFDGKKPDADWGDLSSHLIINFVGGAEPGKIPASSYGGKITIQGNCSGLLLAPNASVDQTKGKWNGEIIADKVEHAGQEIHEKSIISGKAVKVSITNTGDSPCSLKVKKEWESQGTTLDKTLTDTFTPVTIRVWQTYEGGTPVPYPDAEASKIVLSKDNNWEVSFDNVPRLTTDGKEYSYFIQELNSSNKGIEAGTIGVQYYNKKTVAGVETKSSVTTYFLEVAIAPGNDAQTLVLTCINTRQSNVLPSTGGFGDLPYMAAGAGTAVVGLLGTGLYYKKKKDEDQEEE